MKRVYLTIDDSPSQDFKKKVDFLLEKKIPAIFFCIGKRMEEREKDIIYAIQKGFIIGNHSYSHKRFSAIPLKEAITEIKKTDDIINDLYKEAGVERKVKVFRFPYSDKGTRFAFNTFRLGKKINTLQRFLKHLGYQQPSFKHIDFLKQLRFGQDIDTFCTYDTEDWNFSTAEQAVKKIQSDSSYLKYNSCNEVIVMHDHKERTEMFFAIIEEIITLGLLFEKIPFKIKKQ